MKKKVATLTHHPEIRLSFIQALYSACLFAVRLISQGKLPFLKWQETENQDFDGHGRRNYLPFLMVLHELPYVSKVK